MASIDGMGSMRLTRVVGARVTAVVVSFNSARTIRQCLEALTASLPQSSEIVVVDNASSDGTQDIVRRNFSSVTVIGNRENVGFGAACNVGALATPRGDFLLFVNPDCIVRRDTVAVLADRLLADTRLGAIGPLLRDHDGRVELSPGPSPGLLTLLGQMFGGASWTQVQLITGALRLAALHLRIPALDANLRRRTGVVPAAGDVASGFLSGACLMVRGVAFDQVGGFDPAFGLYYEDADLSERLRRQLWSLWFEPLTEVLHIGGVSSAGRFRRYHPVAYLGLVTYLSRHVGWSHAWLARGLIAAATTARLLVALVSGSSASNRTEVRDLTRLVAWSLGLRHARLD